MRTLLADDRSLWLARLLLVRGLGVLCLVAFLAAVNQFRPLLGENGLLPVPLFVRTVPFREVPSLFYLVPHDWAFASGAWLGVVLSLLVVTGMAERVGSWGHLAIWAVIYLLYLSFVNVGQIFYAFGWESILLEACFLAMFLGAAHALPRALPIWLFRWLLFRIMFGAGLIKLRGDACWRDLTCLDYFYETQPMPNPLAWYAHWGPRWFHRTGVAFNHFAELVVPFFYFLPQPFAGIAGIITIVFQFCIAITGNLSWLNWLTIVLAFSTLDAKFLSFIKAGPAMLPSGNTWAGVQLAVGVLVALLSIPVVANMLSSRQIMNTSFNAYHLVGTYGAFGSITRPRYEVVLEGTEDARLTPGTVWHAYEFKGKPGDPYRMPPQIAPYHLRLDWLMWFAAMGSYNQNSWFVPLVVKLLDADGPTLSLLRSDPFSGRKPHYLRARLFEYHFTSPAEHQRTGAWWTRTEASEYLGPVSRKPTTAKSRD